ncbi:hypothetical protein [Streptomyces sp. NBC_01465]|uniref:hypothetical protein n=1 Tax=Streptomyces sp. NBC_01465 TaxID=2903878 RepID=UPI002E2EC1A6|nr:hypothetical protein [Streptomyces sp. NBC_01465]
MTATRPPRLLIVCAAVALVQLCGVLPVQIHWADDLALYGGGNNNPLPADSTGILDALRLPTVSPTWLYGGNTGISAVLHEALWLALFLTVLCTTAGFVSRRLGGGRFVLLHYPAALFLLAPLAHFIALLVMRSPDLINATDNGDVLTTALKDAHTGTLHAALLGAAAALTALLFRTSPGTPNSSRPSGRRVLLFALATLRGDRRTLWRRIGKALLAGAAYCALFTVLSSSALSDAARATARLWCSGIDTRADICAYNLGEAALGPLPLRISTLFNPEFGTVGARYLTLFAYLAAFVVGAYVYYALDALLGPRARPLTPAGLLVRHWAGYATAAFIETAVIAINDHPGISAPSSALTRMSDAAARIMYSDAVPHILLAAPAAAAALTAVALLCRPRAIRWIPALYRLI